MAKSFDHNHRVVRPQSDECLTADRIQALLEDAISPAESAVVEEHLSTCEHCRTHLEKDFGVPQWWPGAAIIVSSQLCEALIRRSFGAWNSSIAIYGLALGTTMIAVGVLGWGYSTTPLSENGPALGSPPASDAPLSNPVIGAERSTP